MNEKTVGKLTLEQLQTHWLIVEAQLAQVFDNPPPKACAADAQALANRFTQYWSDWVHVSLLP